MNSFNRLFCAV